MLFLFLFISVNQLFSQTCSTSTGVNLTSAGGPYSYITVRDQGALGTCFSHSATDLLRSYIKTNLRFNILDAALNVDTEANGGQPYDVLQGLIKRGYACTDPSLFSNWFPSSQKNLFTELQSITISMPVFYSTDIHSPEGAQRQLDIANKAAQMANNPTDCVRCVKVDKKQEDLSLNYNKISELNMINVRLRTEKNSFDWSWLNTLLGRRTNEEIDAEIKKNQEMIKKITQITDSLKKDRDKELYFFNDKKHQLDSITLEEAAQVVYYSAKDHYKDFYKILKNYNVSEKYIPTLGEFIIERVQKHPEYGFTYAGAMYPYALLKKLMDTVCEKNRLAIPNNIKPERLHMTPAKSAEAKNIIANLLESKTPQGLNINFHTAVLRATPSATDGQHAVNIVGCRTKNGELQYLLHNSWGTGCSSYNPKFECVGGRVWVPANALLNKSTEITWLTKKN